jgi:hypothetical protein
LEHHVSSNPPSAFPASVRISKFPELPNTAVQIMIEINLKGVNSAAKTLADGSRGAVAPDRQLEVLRRSVRGRVQEVFERDPPTVMPRFCAVVAMR